MAVVAAFELDNGIASGEAARQANGAHAGFGAAGHQAHHFDRRHELANGFSHVDFVGRGRAETQRAGGCPMHRLDDLRMSVPGDHRSPGTDVVDIARAFGVDHVGAFGAVDKARHAADLAKCAHRRVDPAGNGELGAIEQLLIRDGHEALS